METLCHCYSAGFGAKRAPTPAEVFPEPAFPSNGNWKSERCAVWSVTFQSSENPRAELRVGCVTWDLGLVMNPLILCALLWIWVYPRQSGLYLNNICYVMQLHNFSLWI